MTVRELSLPKEKISDFCIRWKITEIPVFGSVLRDDFRPDSDIDILVSFVPEADWGLFDHIAMEEELSRLLNQKVDLVSRRTIEQGTNWIRRHSILDSAQLFYAQR